MDPASLDTETKLIRPGLQAPPMVCVSYAELSGDKGVLHSRDPKTQGRIRELFSKDPLFGLNMAYDVTVIMEEYPDLIPCIFAAYADDRVIDVGLQQKIVDISQGIMRIMQARGYGLAKLEKRLFKRDRSAEKEAGDAWRLRYGELMDVPIEDWPAAAYNYALDDATGTLEIGMKQIERWLPLLRDVPAQTRADLSLKLMSCWGVRTDPERVLKLKESAERLRDEVFKELVEAGLVRNNGVKNVRAAQKHMLEVCKEQGFEPKLTKKGYETYAKLLKDEENWKPPSEVFCEVDHIRYTCIDQDACETSLDRLMIRYGRYIQLQAVVKTHVPDLMKGCVPGGVIQARFNCLVDSGRTSCSKGKPKKKTDTPTQHGFQLQNPKRAEDLRKLSKFGLEALAVNIRECFIARPGTLFADCDYGGLELCTVSQVCMEVLGWSKMGEALNKGIDVHLWMASKVLGITYEEAVHRKHETEIKNARQLCKICNFGYPGGLSAKGFVAYARGYGVKISQEEAAELKRMWLETWPEFNDYFRWVRNQLQIGDDDLENLLDGVEMTEEALEKLTLKMPSGTAQQLYVGRYRGRCRFTVLANTMFQGLGADGAKAGMWEVTRRCYDPSMENILFGARPWNFVHDQIVTEVSMEIAHEQAVEQARVMIDACNKFLPDVPVKCEPALGKWWSKELEGVYDINGRLVPYDIAKMEKQKVFYPSGQDVNWEPTRKAA